MTRTGLEEDSVQSCQQRVRDDFPFIVFVVKEVGDDARVVRHDALLIRRYRRLHKDTR